VARRNQALRSIDAALERVVADVLVHPTDVADLEQSKRAVAETVSMEVAPQR
jgi:NADP-dependent 3-hydroxy acid dehydrogenase YdfG